MLVYRSVCYCRHCSLQDRRAKTDLKSQLSAPHISPVLWPIHCTGPTVWKWKDAMASMASDTAPAPGCSYEIRAPFLEAADGRLSGHSRYKAQKGILQTLPLINQRAAFLSR